MKPFKVVSYFTEKTGYEIEAKKLAKSLRRFEIDSSIIGINSLGNWFRNTHYKALFIQEMLDLYRRHNIVFVDCDAEFKAYPELFKKMDGYDFAAHFRNWHLHKNELLSGTLFFANNKPARMIIEEWIIENAKNPGHWDQWTLKRVIERNSKIRIFRLPAQYCCIYDSMTNVKDPVILHYQASRKYRYEVG